MRLLAIVALAILPACATDAADPSLPQAGQPGDIPQPSGDGKADSAPVSCGDDTCASALCSFDASAPGEQLVRACVDEGRDRAFVAASVTGAESASVDSRTNPYEPGLSLDNVLIYGCDVWNYAADNKGLEIEYTELRHGALTAGGAPSEFDHKIDIYLPYFTGAGTYTGQGAYTASDIAESAGHRYEATEGCTATVAEDGTSGTFECTLADEASAEVTVSGSFACPGNAIDLPVFSAWQPPQR
jgi:hypothetical protein